jgi:hypothetical protein
VTSGDDAFGVMRRQEVGAFAGTRRLPPQSIALRPAVTYHGLRMRGARVGLRVGARFLSGSGADVSLPKAEVVDVFAPPALGVGGGGGNLHPNGVLFSRNERAVYCYPRTGDSLAGVGRSRGCIRGY